MGSHPDEIAQGAKILVDLGYDVIDVNLACPVKKIKKKCRGGHLMQVPDEAAAILDAVRQAVPAEIPTTVKLRRGTDDSPEALENFHQIFQSVIRLGYAAATVHGRTVEQKYIGPSNWDFLKSIVSDYGKDISIFGSGDIWEAADIFRMIDYTGVQGVSVARGCIGNPWIFTQARAILNGDVEGGTRPPTLSQQREVLLEHFELSVAEHGQDVAGRLMRKFGIKFSRHHPQGEEVARAFIGVHNLEDWRQVLDRFYPQQEPAAVA